MRSRNHNPLSLMSISVAEEVLNGQNRGFNRVAIDTKFKVGSFPNKVFERRYFRTRIYLRFSIG